MPGATSSDPKNPSNCWLTVLLIASISFVGACDDSSTEQSSQSADQSTPKQSNADDDSPGDFKLEQLSTFNTNLDGGPWYEVTWNQIDSHPDTLHGQPVTLRTTFVSGFEKLYLTPKEGESHPKIWVDVSLGRGDVIFDPPAAFWHGNGKHYDVRIAGTFYTRTSNSSADLPADAFQHKLIPDFVEFPKQKD